MALPGFLHIVAGGEDAPVLFGEDTTQASIGGTDVSACLECTAFEVALETGQQAAPGGAQATGHRVWTPARFVVRAGKSTPWIFEAARMNKRIDLTLHLFRRPSARGAVQQHLQYRIQQGRIIWVRLVQPDALDRATASLPERVEFGVVPNISEVESMTGGTVMTDDWAARGV
jgi:type VI secretion system Hcp family effector